MKQKPSGSVENKEEHLKISFEQETEFSRMSLYSMSVCLSQLKLRLALSPTHSGMLDEVTCDLLWAETQAMRQGGQ